MKKTTLDNFILGKPIKKRTLLNFISARITYSIHIWTVIQTQNQISTIKKNPYFTFKYVYRCSGQAFNFLKSDSSWKEFTGT